MKYRKKPVVIEAVQWDGTTNGAFKINRELGHGYTHHVEKGEMYIPTLEGQMIARKGDYIIKGVSGEFYPCKPDIFALTYEPVEESKQ